MKKVAIVCAAGRQGTCLVNEAVSRGYDVTGFVRGGDKVANPKAKTVVKDLFELTSEDLSGVRRGDRRVRRMDARNAARCTGRRLPTCAMS